MSKLEVLVLPIDKVENHPNADRLSINRIREYVAVSNKLEDGSHRYKEGQMVAYVPLGAKVPHSLLKARGYWDEEKDQGFLGGHGHDVVMAVNLRRVVSRGLIFPIENGDAKPPPGFGYLRNGDGHSRLVKMGDDVTDFLGITKVDEPYKIDSVIPSPPDIRYHIEDMQKFPRLLEGHQVVVTELLHGIMCVVGYDRTLNDPRVVMTGTGQRTTGDNIYTQIASGVWDSMEQYLKEMPAVERFYMFGEIIGPGIQDLTYGLDKPEFRAFDVLMGLMGGGRDSIPFGYLGVSKYQLFKWFGIQSVPILWGGKYDLDSINQLSDGPSAIGGGMRKGIVVTSEDENFVGGKRPIFKNISDKFLLRTKGTNYK